MCETEREREKRDKICECKSLNVCVFVCIVFVRSFVLLHFVFRYVCGSVCVCLCMRECVQAIYIYRKIRDKRLERQMRKK